MHEDHEIFIQAVKDRKKIILTYFCGEHSLYLTRLCVPIDYYKPAVSEGGSDCYYFWDSEANVGGRMLRLPPSQVKYMELSDETFDPNDYTIPQNNSHC